MKHVLTVLFVVMFIFIVAYTAISASREPYPVIVVYTDYPQYVMHDLPGYLEYDKNDVAHFLDFMRVVNAYNLFTPGYVFSSHGTIEDIEMASFYLSIEDEELARFSEPMLISDFAQFDLSSWDEDMPACELLPYWYRSGDFQTLDRPMPLFANRGDSQYVSIILPQTVEVLRWSGNWLKIDSYLGPKWIDTDFEPHTQELDDFLRRFGQRIGVFYKNLETGFVYTFNPSRVFFGESISKLTHAFYTFIAAERGYVDMYGTHIYRAADYWGGSGIMRFNYHVGAEFTTRELLYYSVVHSDNIAFRMLVRYMEQTGFSYRDFAMELGANPWFMLDRYMYNASPEDAGLWLYAIQEYFQSDSRYGHHLQEDLLNVALYSHPYFTRGYAWGGSSDINVQFIHSDYPVAQKYGWGSIGFNVMGIVYAPSPYLLIILSNMSAGAHELFEEISWKIQDFNVRYFAATTE